MKLILNKQIIQKWILYVAGGGTAALIDLLFLYIFTDIVGLHYLVSTVGSFCIAFLYGFFFQKYITFKNNAGNFHKQMGLFFIFQIVWLGINAGLLWIFVDQLHFYYLYAAVFNKGLIFIRNFLMNYFYNFKS
jgi:putative flippase GtrA